LQYFSAAALMHELTHPATIEQIEPKHPTIAVSDGFMAATAWIGFLQCYNANEVTALGFACFGAACSAGVLRFGFNPEFFRPWNECLAQMAGRVGIPMLGLGYLTAYLPETRAAIAVSDTSLIFLLFLLFAASLPLGKKTGETYTTICGVCGMGPILQFGMNTQNKYAIAGVLVFVCGGVLIGPDRERYILGVRRENLFHYALGTALLLIMCAIPPFEAPM
jgi:hypothetical protein